MRKKDLSPTSRRAYAQEVAILKSRSRSTSLSMDDAAKQVPRQYTFTTPSPPFEYMEPAVRVEQADIGTFEVPDWKKEEVEKMRETINVVASTVMDSSKIFGKKEELDPVYWMLGAALGWGGLPAEAATYVNVFPEKNDGKTPSTLTVKDVPVDAFWSVTLYDDKGWMPVNKYKAYSFNNVTAKKDKDGRITIHFGGDPKADNFLPIVPGWNYIVRLYRPRKEILDGSWTFPRAQVVEPSL